MNPILDAFIQQANSETSQETSQETSPNQSQPQPQQQDDLQPSIFDYLFDQVNANAITDEKPLTIGEMVMQGYLVGKEKSK